MENLRIVLPRERFGGPRIADYRFSNRIGSEAEAVRRVMLPVARIGPAEFDTLGRHGGPSQSATASGEAHKLFDEISNMLTEMRRELLASVRKR
jgi:hypothetical protein